MNTLTHKRAQLALILALRDMLPGLASPPQLYDPAFTPTDAALLAALGLALIPVDERGARAAEGPTLFYLPHCEARRGRAPARAPGAGERGNGSLGIRE
jgi:hypothetical protein